MGPIARVLWECLPELLHVGGVLTLAALMLAIMGTALFGDRAASFSTFSGTLLASYPCCTSDCDQLLLSELLLAA